MPQLVLVAIVTMRVNASNLGRGITHIATGCTIDAVSPIVTNVTAVRIATSFSTVAAVATTFPNASVNSTVVSIAIVIIHNKVFAISVAKAIVMVIAICAVAIIDLDDSLFDDSIFTIIIGWGKLGFWYNYFIIVSFLGPEQRMLLSFTCGRRC